MFCVSYLFERDQTMCGHLNIHMNIVRVILLGNKQVCSRLVAWLCYNWADIVPVLMMFKLSVCFSVSTALRPSVTPSWWFQVWVYWCFTASDLLSLTLNTDRHTACDDVYTHTLRFPFKGLALLSFCITVSVALPQNQKQIFLPVVFCICISRLFMTWWLLETCLRSLEYNDKTNK